MTLPLPPTIEAYFDASNAAAPEALAALFTTDGVVRDEGEMYVGPTAIADWARQVQAKYATQIEAIAAAVEGDNQIVTARVAGAFPGSPIELTHRFTLKDTSIAALEIGQ